MDRFFILLPTKGIGRNPCALCMRAATTMLKQVTQSSLSSSSPAARPGHALFYITCLLKRRPKEMAAAVLQASDFNIRRGRRWASGIESLIASLPPTPTTNPGRGKSAKSLSKNHFPMFPPFLPPLLFPPSSSFETRDGFSASAERCKER